MRKVNFKKIQDGYLIDIRDKQDFDRDHLINSINYPQSFLEKNYKTLLNTKTKYYLICYIGKSSNTLSKKLSKENYKTFFIKGGYKKIKKLLKQ